MLRSTTEKAMTIELGVEGFDGCDSMSVSSSITFLFLDGQFIIAIS